MASSVRDFARALEQVRPDLVANYLVPAGMPISRELTRDLAGKVATTGEEGSIPESVRVFHSTSVSDLSQPTAETWPPEVERLGLRFSASAPEVVALLVPPAGAELTLRRRCRARCEVLRQADAVLAASEEQRGELVRLARVENDSITIVGSGAPWSEVAERAIEVFDALAARPRRPGGRGTQLQVAVVSPLPPIHSGVADYSDRLLEALAGALESLEVPVLIDCFADGRDITPDDPVLPRGMSSWFDARRFIRVDQVRGGYDRVLYVAGNSEFHTGALSALRSRRGTVLAHEVRMSGLLELTSRRSDTVPGGLEGALRRAVGDDAFDALELPGPVTAADVERLGLFLVREIASLADRVLVSSESSRALAVAEAPELADRFAVLPFALARRPEELEAIARARSGRRAARPLVASFGIVDPHKLPRLLVEALAAVRTEPAPDLVFVGPVGDTVAKELSGVAASLGVAERVRITGHVEQADYLDYLGRASVAVQLRASFAGESSAAVADCLAAGLPTVVSNLGWMRELPDDVVTKVNSSAEDAAVTLAATIDALLVDEDRSASLGERAARYAAERTYERAATELASLLGLVRPKEGPET